LAVLTFITIVVCLAIAAILATIGLLEIVLIAFGAGVMMTLTALLIARFTVVSLLSFALSAIPISRAGDARTIRAAIITAAIARALFSRFASGGLLCAFGGLGLGETQHRFNF
jgi:hypothetical protein